MKTSGQIIELFMSCHEPFDVAFHIKKAVPNNKTSFKAAFYLTRREVRPFNVASFFSPCRFFFRLLICGGQMAGRSRRV